MKTCFILAIVCSTLPASAQTPKTELYALIKSLLYDSTGYSNVGDWAVGNPKKFAVKWNVDRIEMSNDTSINFFRNGKVFITRQGKPWPIENNGQWNIMLKGPRMGYASFSMISPASVNWKPDLVIDSFFAGKNFKARLLKSCTSNPVTGFHYYEVKLPKKDLAYIKISWITANGKTAYRIDEYDDWSRRSAKLDCK